MNPPLTLTHTLWASTIIVGAFVVWLAITLDQPHMAVAAATVLTVTILSAIPEPKENT